MTHRNVLTKFSLTAIFALTLVLLVPESGGAQSTDPEHPTAITAFPLVGRLAAGTYYYSVPVSAGPGTMRLEFTPPTGGATISVSLSGPDCCTADAYVSGSSTTATMSSVAEPFSIPSAQTLLVTLNISIRENDTVRFTVGASFGGRSAVIVTPPETRTPPTTPGAVCTDLSIDYYRAAGVGLTKAITGEVRNRTTTHPYKGFPRGQWIEIFDITDSEKAAPRVTFIRLPDIIDPGASFSFRALHTTTTVRRTRYMIKIVYSPNHATDRSPYNDDCNADNNVTRRQIIGEMPLDLEPVPPRP